MSRSTIAPSLVLSSIYENDTLCYNNENWNQGQLSWKTRENNFDNTIELLGSHTCLDFVDAY